MFSSLRSSNNLLGEARCGGCGDAAERAGLRDAERGEGDRRCANRADLDTGDHTVNGIPGDHSRARGGEGSSPC